MDWLWYVLAAAGGMVAGGLTMFLFMKGNVRMYRMLWENERNGNYIMTQRLVALEDERMNIEGDG